MVGRPEAQNVVRNPGWQKQKGETKPGNGSKLQGERCGRRQLETIHFLLLTSHISKMFSPVDVSNERGHGSEEGHLRAQRSRTSVKTLPLSGPFITQLTLELCGFELHLRAHFFGKYG